MIQQSYNCPRINASAAATANRSAPTAFSRLRTEKPESSTGMAAWNAAPAPKTVRWMPSTSIRITAAAAQPTLLTTGLPGFSAKRPPDAAADHHFSLRIPQNAHSKTVTVPALFKKKSGPKTSARRRAAGNPVQWDTPIRFTPISFNASTVFSTCSSFFG